MKIVKVIRIIHDRSGFGIIHEIQAEDGNRYARKTFRPNGPRKFSDDEVSEFRRRFSREVRVQEKFSSDYCVPIIYSELNVENPWFLMPIASKTFQDEINLSRIKRNPPNGLSDILNCLEYVHKRGYVHRDVKPGNILFVNDQWKLADMGLITSDPELTTSFKTKSGEAFGSLPYMAPEQYTDFQNVTYKADIYSFGAILHDIYAGTPRKPYSKLTAAGTMGVIIEKCTEENPDNRFGDIASLRNLLLSKLSKSHVPKDIEKEANELLQILWAYKTWEKSDFDTFVTSIEREPALKNALFFDISHSFISDTRTIDIRNWRRFVRCFLSWVASKSFDFNYCDVLIGQIIIIYDITNDLAIKSEAVFAGAELAASHNRFYCMREVLKMCSPDISDTFAERISIEIYAKSNRAKNNLIRCVEGLGTNLNAYHPEIVEALNEL